MRRLRYAIAIGLLAGLLVAWPRYSSADTPKYWPGHNALVPPAAYDARIEVVDTLRGSAWYRHHRDTALREWNACGGVRLVVTDLAPYTPGSITITHSDEKWTAFGGVTETYGVVFLAGGWSRGVDVIAHEFGHALGFGHTALYSVMGPANDPTTLDCQGLRAYYAP